MEVLAWPFFNVSILLKHVFQRIVSGYQEIGMFSSQPAAPTTTSSANGLADILQPMSTGPFASQQPQPQAKKLTTDVDSSLALAATNLSLELGGGGTSTGTGLGSGIQKK